VLQAEHEARKRLGSDEIAGPWRSDR
jgi:hypothetical protein